VLQAVGETVIIDGVTLTATASGTPTSIEFYQGGSAGMDAISLANAINAHTTLSDVADKYTATVSGAVVTVAHSHAGVAVDMTAETGTHAGITQATVEATSELDNLMDQYNVMRTQITELAEDAGYKGKNLLSNTPALRALTVQFEGTTLAVAGFDATAGGLAMTAAEWTTGVAADKIAADLVLADAALVTMRQNSSQLAGNLSIIVVRNDFSTNIINTLIEGSDKLTLADSNEEGANMLMLQTRQTLATTALSLSAQAAQSVLRLFQ
jgi:flagellin